MVPMAEHEPNAGREVRPRTRLECAGRRHQVGRRAGKSKLYDRPEQSLQTLLLRLAQLHPRPQGVVERCLKHGHCLLALAAKEGEEAGVFDEEIAVANRQALVGLLLEGGQARLEQLLSLLEVASSALESHGLEVRL